MLGRPFLLALVIGAAVQVAMVLLGHWISYIKDNLFAVGGVLISLAGGVAYARATGVQQRLVWLVSALVGGLCGLIGIAVSFVLGDVPASILLFGTLGSAVGGLLGGAVGRALARNKAP